MRNGGKEENLCRQNMEKKNPALIWNVSKHLHVWTIFDFIRIYPRFLRTSNKVKRNQLKTSAIKEYEV